MLSVALSDIECALTDLNIRDVYGDRCDGWVAFGAVAKHVWSEWEMNYQDLIDGRINVETFRSTALMLVDVYARQSMREKAEKILSGKMRYRGVA